MSDKRILSIEHIEPLKSKDQYISNRCQTRHDELAVVLVGLGPMMGCAAKSPPNAEVQDERCVQSEGLSASLLMIIDRKAWLS